MASVAPLLLFVLARPLLSAPARTSSDFGNSQEIQPTSFEDEIMWLIQQIQRADGRRSSGDVWRWSVQQARETAQLKENTLGTLIAKGW